MTDEQKLGVRNLLEDLHPDSVVFGDGDGADAEFFEMVREVLPDAIIVARPGHNARGNSPTRAHMPADKVMDSEPYLVRDKKIVKDADVMIATPHSYVEIVRSGTWATVRYARKAGKPIYLILPDGLLGS